MTGQAEAREGAREGLCAGGVGGVEAEGPTEGRPREGGWAVQLLGTWAGGFLFPLGHAWHPAPPIRAEFSACSQPPTTGRWLGAWGPDCGSGDDRLEEGQRPQDGDRQAQLSAGQGRSPSC